MYPGVNQAVDFNAQRLARTSVTHAYQLSFQRATIDNPFVTAYRWHSSNSSRVCDVCLDREGRLYPKDELPLDHPLGMCTVTAEIPKSYREIGEELGDWAAGGENPALDRWLNPTETSGKIGLAPAEERVLNEYISSGSYKINAALRYKEPLTVEQMSFVRELDSALEKMPVYRGTVYRSLSDIEIDDVEAFVQSYTVGGRKTPLGYISAGTKVYDESFPVQYVIQSQNGRDIRVYNPDESEILFARNSKFYVEKVEGHTIFLQEA